MTTQSQSHAAKDLFYAALDLPPAERPQFLEGRGADPGVRDHVLSLLAAHENAGSFLGATTFDGRPSPESSHLSERLQTALAGRYWIEREIGHGGMGIVYLARDVALERPVAIKLLPPRLAENAEYRRRFLREARTAAALSHPHIVPIHLVEESGDLVYFVMAWVDGESLGERVRRAGRLDASVLAKIVQEVAWALAYAHSRGVIHRDVKPDNILLDSANGRAMLTDFGIAQVSTQATASRPGEVLGTFRFMSPEQASVDRGLDGRSDLYSLGVTAFYALTGRLPFEGEDPVTLLSQHITQPPPPVSSIRRDVPILLAEAIDRCLAKDPEMRFASGELLAEAIAGAQLVRRETPLAVREFLDALKGGLAQLGGAGVVWLTVWMVSQRVAPSRPMAGGPLDPLLTVLGAMTVLIAFNPLRAARELAREGFYVTDVAYAITQSTHDALGEQRRARAREVGERLARPWWRIPLGLAAVAYTLFAIRIVLAIATGAKLRLPLPDIVAFALSPLSVVFLSAAAIAPRRLVAYLSSGTPEHTSVLRWLVTSAPARWLMRVTTAGLRGHSERRPPADSPTEVLIGRAAQEIVDSLPVDAKARLGDLGGIVADLERVAASLRARRNDLDAAIADVGAIDRDSRGSLVRELTTAKTDVETRLSSAVAALDNLRLDLLRLRTGMARVADLTPSIEAARAASEAIEIELAAWKEAERIAT